MANYVQYSPWTDAAAYGRGLGDTLSQAMLQMPQQRAALAQQAAMEQTRQREEAQKLAQTEAYHTASLGLGRDKLEEIRRQNAMHDLEMQSKMKGTWMPYQNKATGEVSLYNPVTGDTKPYTMAAPAAGGAASTGGGLGAPFRLTPPATQGQELEAILKGTALLGAAEKEGWPTNNAPAWYNLTNNIMPVVEQAKRGLGLGQPTAVAPLGVPTGAPPVAGLTNTPASAMMPGMTNAAPIKAYNPATGRIE